MATVTMVMVAVKFDGCVHRDVNATGAETARATKLSTLVLTTISAVIFAGRPD